MKNATDASFNGPLSEAGFRRPLIIGEVLFDCFPDGRSVIGGAPFNVAWNLRGLGVEPLFISAVGDDPLGAKVFERMDDWRMETRGLEVLPALPTGRVDVANADTDPTYTFQDDCAWDHIRLPGVEFSPDTFGLLYHGSLAARAETSRKSILKLRDDPALPVFIDLNLRAPFFEPSALPGLAKGAHWLKLNTDELDLLSDVLNLREKGVGDRASRLRKDLGVAHVLVTDGAQGAYWISDAPECAFRDAAKVDNFVDSVGAGDAFASVAIFGIMHNWPPSVILQRAVKFAAKVCEIQGATTHKSKFYDDERKQWK